MEQAGWPRSWQLASFRMDHTSGSAGWQKLRCPSSEALVLVGSPEQFEATPYLNPMYSFVGIILVSAFFQPRVACAAMVVLALGDGVAGLVGRAAGKHALRTIVTDPSFWMLLGRRTGLPRSLRGLWRLVTADMGRGPGKKASFWAL